MTMRLLLLIILAIAAAAAAQPRSADDDTARDQALVETLRAEDTALADRYIALRDERARALAALQKVEAQYNGIGPGLRQIYAAPYRDARRKYATASIALLDFFEARDRAIITRYQEEIGKINGFIEERRKTRAEYEKMLAP
jgi:hypothetical protein